MPTPSAENAWLSAAIAAVEILRDDLNAETDRRFAVWFPFVTGGVRP
jgi:hypothetical protein